MSIKPSLSLHSQNDILQYLIPTLNNSISFRMVYGGANVLDISFLQEMFELG